MASWALIRKYVYGIWAQYSAEMYLHKTRDQN